jgi:hypothetical protein
LGFLGAWPVRRENPVYRLLDFLGFPWILSSETRLINGLYGINRQKFFVTLLSVAAAPRRRLTLLPRGQAGSLIGQAYPDFRFSAINCRPSRSTRRGQSKAAASSAEFYQAPPKRSGRADPAEIRGEVSHLASDTLDAGAEPACRQTRGEGRTDGDYRCVNLTDFSIMARWNHFAPSGFLAAFPPEERMSKARSAHSDPRFYGLPVEDQRPLTLLRRLVIEIEDSIAQSRAVILSTRDAIELLERLEGRQFSN